MEIFQGLPSADTILFATLTTRPKTRTSEEASEAIDVPYYYASDDGKVVEFQNTPEAAQAMLHLSLKKTLPVGVLLDALISLDGETTSKPEGGKFKLLKFGSFRRQVHSIPKLAIRAYISLSLQTFLLNRSPQLCTDKYSSGQ